MYQFLKLDLLYLVLQKTVAFKFLSQEIKKT